MEQTVYIDVFFLINFSMDFLGLFLGNKLLGRKESLLRLFLAAVFGGLYACFTLIFSLDSISPLLSFAVDAIACVVIAFIAVFHRKACRGVFSFALVFGAVSILLGGAMTALFYAFNRLGIDKAFGNEESQSGDGISVWIFVIFASISALITLLGGKLFKKKALRQSGFIEIEYRRKKIKFDCICDSGNLLREPISHLPCVLVEFDAVQKIFSKEFCAFIKCGDVDKTNNLNFFEASRVRMIPAQTASGESLLVGFRPDAIRIDMGKGMSAFDAYIVFSKEKISADGIKALVPSELAFGAV